MLQFGTTPATQRNYSEHCGTTPAAIYSVNSNLTRFGTTPVSPL